VGLQNKYDLNVSEKPFFSLSIGQNETNLLLLSLVHLALASLRFMLVANNMFWASELAYVKWIFAV
jgi:hypothetical protein